MKFSCQKSLKVDMKFSCPPLKSHLSKVICWDLSIKIWSKKQKDSFIFGLPNVSRKSSVESLPLESLGLKSPALKSFGYLLFVDWWKWGLKGNSNRQLWSGAKSFAHIPSISSIYEFRWIASEHRTVKNVLKSWKALVENLKAVSEDTSFDQSTRQKASALYAEITGARFLLLLNFFLDVLQDLKLLSLKLQKTGALLVTQTKTLLELQASILLLSDEDGQPWSHLKLLLHAALEQVVTSMWPPVLKKNSITVTL